MTYYNLKLVSIKKYLQNKGWSITEDNDHFYKISLISKGENFDIIIPKKENTFDYEFRVEQLIRSLSSIEKRNTEEIMQEIQNIGYDTVKFRFISEKYEGTMPLDNFADAVDKIYDIIKFEACSELNPQSQYTNPYDEAKTLVSHCEVPQTEKGSYIININVPLGETYLQIKKDDEYLRFLGRNTLIRMLSGINEAKEINLTNEKSFNDSYNKKLNRNTCKAIKELLEDVKGAKIEINTRWDISRPLATTPPENAKITEADKEKFATMEEYLVKIPEDEEKIINGVIQDMRRSKDNDKEQTITVYDSSLNRNVYIELREESYDMTCNLYRKIASVSVKGILKKKNSKWILENYNYFGAQLAL